MDCAASTTSAATALDRPPKAAAPAIFFAVGPSVIPAAKKIAGAAAFGGRSSAVAADVVEAAQSMVGAADDQQRLVDQARREVVPGLGDLIAVADHLPGAGEDLVSFLGSDSGIDVEGGRQGPGAGDVGVDVQGVEQGHGSGYTSELLYGRGWTFVVRRPPFGCSIVAFARARYVSVLQCASSSFEGPAPGYHAIDINWLTEIVSCAVWLLLEGGEGRIQPRVSP